MKFGQTPSNSTGQGRDSLRQSLFVMMLTVETFILAALALFVLVSARTHVTADVATRFSAAVHPYQHGSASTGPALSRHQNLVSANRLASDEVNMRPNGFARIPQMGVSPALKNTQRYLYRDNDVIVRERLERYQLTRTAGVWLLRILRVTILLAAAPPWLADAASTGPARSIQVDRQNAATTPRSRQFYNQGMNAPNRSATRIAAKSRKRDDKAFDRCIEDCAYFNGSILGKDEEVCKEGLSERIFQIDPYEGNDKGEKCGYFDANVEECVEICMKAVNGREK